MRTHIKRRILRATLATAVATAAGGTVLAIAAPALNLSALHHQVGGSEFGNVQCPLHHRKCIGVKKSFSQRAAQKRHDFLACG